MEDRVPSVDTRLGLLRGSRQLASPNHDVRPPGAAMELIVVHGISLPAGMFGGPWIDRLFTNTLDPAAHPSFAQIAPLRVSSHLLIGREGALTQYVPFHLRAWHAGESVWCGRTRCNDFSVGIELEGADTIAYEPVQYRQLAVVILALCEAYPTLSRHEVVGHHDIAPGRKSDPGPAFDWQRLRSMLA
jgi:AmpD protein